MQTGASERRRVILAFIIALKKAPIFGSCKVFVAVEYNYGLEASNIADDLSVITKEGLRMPMSGVYMVSERTSKNDIRPGIRTENSNKIQAFKLLHTYLTNATIEIAEQFVTANPNYDTDAKRKEVFMSKLETQLKNFKMITKVGADGRPSSIVSGKVNANGVVVHGQNDDLGFAVMQGASVFNAWHMYNESNGRIMVNPTYAREKRKVAQ